MTDWSGVRTWEMLLKKIIWTGNVIIFVVHRSPVCKFANASGGVGHGHKLTKLVEESNNLIYI